MEDKHCLVCGHSLKKIGVESIQLDKQKHKSLFSSRDRILQADVYICQACGYVERFNRAVTGGDPTAVSIYDGTALITCSRCGKIYEPAFGHCPCCGWVEEEKL